ncbi:GSU3473 family protein [Geomesophilobacter sediminis]|uniref:Uncharacterized protein n=1 Tax=Geomesophilobacter sediminis TaxID=2798584 RepID=A0A8J7S7C5_9BACT|nr:hypothetical protein [Geomesophilobacter sediminis]MBJ6726956.1 hypothetical protein [Geomesophilobacter sediminis]
MGILVCYDEFTYDVVSDYHLEFLIKSKCITGYVEDGNWVRLEEDVEGNGMDPRVRRTSTLRTEKEIDWEI